MQITRIGVCKSLQYIALQPSKYNWTECVLAERSKYNMIIHSVIHGRCGMKDCIYGLPIPFPTNLKALDLHRTRPGKNALVNPYNTSALCVDSSNTLEYLVISSNTYPSGTDSAKMLSAFLSSD